MLAFITSLRHPDNSADYARVEQLLSETIGSVTAQTSDDYVVIIVGNKHPSVALPDRAKFVKVGFPAPAPPTGPRTAREPFVWDKGTKIGVGLLAAREYNPDFVMIFDADDFVSNRLAAYVNENLDSAGWVISNGWMYSKDRNAIRPIKDFNRTCGTSFIIPFAAYDVPLSVPITFTQDEVGSYFEENLQHILGAHRDAVEWHLSKGRTLTTLPFRGAVYHVDTGENHSGKGLQGLALPLSNRFRREFSIPSSRGKIPTLWRSAGPTPIRESASGAMRRLRNRGR